MEHLHSRLARLVGIEGSPHQGTGGISPGAELNRGLLAADAGEALECFLRAAALGCRRAQFCAGLAYHLGRGAPADYGLAAKWYEMAAGQGEANAMANLGMLYLHGQGVEADAREAYTWMASAAGLGRKSLRPIAARIEARIRNGELSGHGPECATPRQPEIPPCRLAVCDPSRCDS